MIENSLSGFASSEFKTRANNFHVLVSRRFLREEYFYNGFERIKNVSPADHTVSKTYRSENGIFDFLMTFSFLI